MKERRIIQVAVDTEYIMALCDDGTLWGYAAGSWALFPPIPQPEVPEKEPRRRSLTSEEKYRVAQMEGFDDE